MPHAHGAPAQAQPVASRLLARYWPHAEVTAREASSHWRHFSRGFRVALNDDGSIRALGGWGFGESEDSRLLIRLFSLVGNSLQRAMLDAPGLEADIVVARDTVRRMGLFFSQDAFRQACTAWLLRRSIGSAPRRIVLIGDGHGILAGILHTHFPDAQIVLADLGATLVFQAFHLGRAFPAETHALGDEDVRAAESARFVYCPADRLESFPDGEIDVAANVASMQEMTRAAVAGYFALLRARRTRLFYCCNRLEKRLPAGEVLRFMEYPWQPEDEHLIDAACPWHQWFVGKSSARHVKIGPLPVPLFHRYDGVHWHRLTRLVPST